MNNLSTLADLETKVFHLSSLGLHGISTDIYLKVIVPVTFYPITLFISFHQFSQSAVTFFTYLFVHLLSISPTRK